jgi:ribonuclease P protein component
MKIETLKKRKDFISSNKFGKKFYTNNFILQKNKDSNNEISNVRFGFTATKRIGNAVNRNRAKRRMRSLISLFLKNDISSFENGNSYVLIAKASLIKASFVNLKNEMKNCLNRL